MMFSQREIWSNVPIENKKGLFNTNGFLAFLQRLPETSIRQLTIDLSVFENTGTLALVDMLGRKKQWQIDSLHVVGRKVTPAILGQIIRRLWPRNLRILSVHDVQGAKIDAIGASKALAGAVPKLTHLRLEGAVDHDSLKRLSSISTGLEQAQILGSNRLTHLSLVGVRATVNWDTFGCFGAWFPELEQLYLFAVLGCERWVKDFAIGEPVPFEVPANFGEPGGLGHFEQPAEPEPCGAHGGAGAYGGIDASGAPGEPAVSQNSTFDPKCHTVTYRTPLREEIKFIPIQRLRSLAIEHFEEAGDKKLAKSQEKVHMAHFWTLIEGCKDSLQRLEIGPADERFFETKKGNLSQFRVGWELTLKTRSQECRSPPGIS
jgi:hypothetical protein